MAITISLYNLTTKRFANKEIDFTKLYLMLLDSGAAFVAANTTLDQVAGSGHIHEFYGNGWPQGGVLLANVVVTTVTTNDAKFTADNVTVTATGGPIGPASAAVIYDNTSGAVLIYIDFGQSEQAGQDTDFKVVWNASGIVTFTY